LAFPVYFAPTSASPPAAQRESDLKGAIAAAGGSLDGRTLRLPDGPRVELDVATQNFQVEALSPRFCQVLFSAALQSDSTVERGGSDVTPLKIKGSRGVTRYTRMRTDIIATPDELCARLQQDLGDWNQFISRSQAMGLIGPDSEPLGPPGDPGSETRLDPAKSGVADQCEDAERSYLRFGWRFSRVVVSLNPRFGVVWRADFTQPGYRSIGARMICSQAQGTDGIRRLLVEIHPLEMFDPKQSLHALEPAAATSRK